MTEFEIPNQPYSIAHRGASAYAPGNSLKAFRIAAELGADMWEIDIRTTGDGIPVVYHDACVASGEAISDLSREALRTLQPDCPDLSDVVSLASEKGAGLYADIKDQASAIPTLRMIEAAKIEQNRNK